MEPSNYIFTQAFQNYLDNKCSPEEANYIMKQLASGKLKATSEQQLEQQLANWDREGLDANAYNEQLTYRLQRIKALINKENTPAAHRIHFLKAAWLRYAAAIILLLGIGGYLLWRESSEIPAVGENDKGSIVQSGPSSSNRAILTLADGSQIILDDKASGNIARQGNTQIIKLDANQLTYNSNLKKTSPPAMEGKFFDPREAGQKPGVGALYNTITTPRGVQYQIILPDGTKVWLNAASSIKFPTSFTGKERRIEATGEIFFEVAANKSLPFFVSSKGSQVQVLGTSFNMKVYEQETAKTTLLEGSIKVDKNLLKPGQAYTNGKTITTDVEQDIAWKNGLFNFKNAGLPTVMRELERWYDINVKYEGNVGHYEFQGEFHRNLKFAQILKMLNEMEVKYRVEGRTLIIVGE